MTENLVPLTLPPLSTRFKTAMNKARGQGPRSLSEQEWIPTGITLSTCEYNFNTRRHNDKYSNKNQVSPHVLFTPTDKDVVVLLPGGYLLLPTRKMSI